MAIKDKLMFWKKERESEELPSLDSGLPGMEPNLPGIEPSVPGMPEEQYGATPKMQTTFHAPGEDSLVPESFDRPVKPRLEPTHLETRQEYSSPKEIEIISAKLENLRLSFEVLNQKLDNIERMLKEKRTW